jgi:hypothetical protein
VAELVHQDHDPEHDKKGDGRDYGEGHI